MDCLSDVGRILHECYVTARDVVRLQFRTVAMYSVFEPSRRVAHIVTDGNRDKVFRDFDEYSFFERYGHGVHMVTDGNMNELFTYFNEALVPAPAGSRVIVTWDGPF